MFGFGEEFFTDEYIMEISSNAMYLILLLSAPMLMSALGVGLVISIIQATTQIQEQTLSFVPKLLATFLSCLICGTWISGMCGGFATRLFTDIQYFGPKRAPAIIVTENAAKEKAGPASVIDGPFIAWGTALLAFVRIVTVFVQAPIFGGQHFKAPIKVGMAASVTLLAFPTLPVPDPFPSDIRGFMLAILSQICVGLVIGWVSFLVMATAQFGGEMLDVQMGLSAAAQADPSSHGAVNLLRRLHFYAAMLTYLMFNGHHKMWEAIFYSFQKIPLTYFQMTELQINTMIAQGSEMYRIGLQISSPAVAALFVAQIALGLLARVAPQMNVFMLSFPMNLAVGLMLLTISLPFILKLLEFRMERNNEQVKEAIQMMIPRKNQPPPSPIPIRTPSPSPT